MGKFVIVVALLHLAAYLRADGVSHYEPTPGSEGKLPLRRQGRADDVSDLQPIVAQLTQDLAASMALQTAMQAQLAALTARVTEVEAPVAFSVHFSRTQVTNLGHDQPVVFDAALYNAGGGYKPNTGAFIAPRAGTYVFVLCLQRNGELESTIIMQITKDASVIGVAEAGYSPFEHGSTTVTVHLQAGDVITVRVVFGSTVFGAMSTVFSGFRVSPS